MHRNDGNVSRNQRDRQKIPHYVVRQFLQQRKYPHRTTVHHQRIAVGRRLGGTLRRQDGVALIFHDDSLPERAGYAIRNQPRDEIIAAASGRGMDTYEFSRIGLGTGGAATQHEHAHDER